MAIPSRVMAAGNSASSATQICGDANGGLTATGTTNADALQLGAVWNQVSTTASGSGVKLMLPETGSMVGVFNSGANALLVYPGTGAQINALTATTGGYSIAAGGRALFMGAGSGNWYANLSA